MDIGLVLSGGGFRGIAHIGAIKALEEHDIRPTHIAGTSAGAIIGALYASGRGWKELLEFFRNVPLFNLNNYALKKPGFFDAEKLHGHFLKYLPHDDFEQLHKPLFVTATNILDGTLQVFQSGELIRPLLASAAFPGVFAPVKIGDGYYVDGGVLNNFPVDLVKGRCGRIVGVYVNPFEKVGIGDLKHFYSVLERVLKIKAAKESLAKFADCDLVVCPHGLGQYGTFAMKDLDPIFKLGYRTATRALKAVDLAHFHGDAGNPISNSESGAS